MTVTSGERGKSVNSGRTADILHHLHGLQSAITRARFGLMDSGGLETDRDILKTLSSGFASELQALVHICGGDDGYIEDTADAIRDDLDNAFVDAIDSRDHPDDAPDGTPPYTTMDIVSLGLMTPLARVRG